MPADVTANARYRKYKIISDDDAITKRETRYLELLVDALKAVNRGVERTYLVAPDLELLLEVLDLACVRVPFSSILSFELVLNRRLSFRRGAKGRSN